MCHFGDARLVWKLQQFFHARFVWNSVMILIVYIFKNQKALKLMYAQLVGVLSDDAMWQSVSIVSRMLIFDAVNSIDGWIWSG